MSAALPYTIASRYRVIRELGRGGMGAVYLVEHTNTGDRLALKLLHGHAGAKPDVVARFKREARAPARIKSENVVKVTDADVAAELDGAPFLVMELLEGQDLEKIVTERGPLPAAEVVDWLSQVARALDKAHAIGIVHRDLKPENLFLHHREDGTRIVKILDFGISKAMGSEAGGSTAEGGGLTKSGAIFGTPLYMAPEQARGRHDIVGPPTDQWAIGLIAYRLLTGEVYWQANTFAALVLQIVSEPLAPPSTRLPTLGPAFDAWFARSCERDPGRRWRTVGHQVVALGEALGVGAPEALPTAPTALVTGAAVAVPPPLIAEAESGIGNTASPLSRTTPQAEFVPQRRLPALLAVGAVIVVGIAATTGVVALRSASSASPGASASELAATASETQSPEPATTPAPPPLSEPPAPSASVSASAKPSARPVPVRPIASKPRASSAPLPAATTAAPAKPPAPSTKTKPKPFAPEAP